MLETARLPQFLEALRTQYFANGIRGIDHAVDEHVRHMHGMIAILSKSFPNGSADARTGAYYQAYWLHRFFL